MTAFHRLEMHHTLSIMPTYQCTAACEHCGTISSPLEKTWLPGEAILNAIDEAASSGYEVVVFTGGEATLAGKNLLKYIERAASYGVVVRLVTNAHWATSEKAADQRIRDFIQAGLTEINYSTGDQHIRFVPLERVIHAIRSAAKARLRTAIMVELMKERRVTKETLENHPGYQQVIKDFPGFVIRIDESPWMPLSPDTVFRYTDGTAVNRDNLPMISGCDSILSTTTIQADGQIGACCGIGLRLIPELQVGNILTTTLAEADRAAADDFLKRWIRVEGPERILAWAASYDSSIEWENMYGHRCQACIRLYKDPKVRAVIMEHHKEKLADVVFAEWLLFHYDPQEDLQDTIAA
jgi:hypothetical protein